MKLIRKLIIKLIFKKNFVIDYNNSKHNIKIKIKNQFYKSLKIIHMNKKIRNNFLSHYRTK